MYLFSISAINYEDWSFYDCIWWGLMTLTTVGKLTKILQESLFQKKYFSGYHIQPQTFLGKLSCGLCALCGVFIITLPIPIVVSSFAVCYRQKLWRNEIAVRKRLAMFARRNTKEDIIFNLNTSSGMSGELVMVTVKILYL